MTLSHKPQTMPLTREQMFIAMNGQINNRMAAHGQRDPGKIYPPAGAAHRNSKSTVGDLLTPTSEEPNC